MTNSIQSRKRASGESGIKHPSPNLVHAAHSNLQRLVQKAMYQDSEQFFLNTDHVPCKNAATTVVSLYLANHSPLSHLLRKSSEFSGWSMGTMWPAW